MNKMPIIMWKYRKPIVIQNPKKEVSKKIKVVPRVVKNEALQKKYADLKNSIKELTKIVEKMPDNRLAGIREYLDKKRGKTDLSIPLADRMAQYKEQQKQKRIQEYKLKKRR